MTKAKKLTVTLTYREGEKTIREGGMKYINAWLAKSFDGSGQVDLMAQFEATNGDYVSINVEQIISMVAR